MNATRIAAAWSGGDIRRQFPTSPRGATDDPSGGEAALIFAFQPGPQIPVRNRHRPAHPRYQQIEMGMPSRADIE